MREYRIYGPPGCGKTTTLGRLVEDTCRQVGSDAILAASFTRAAARELVGRNLPIDEFRIGTLHAHCYRSMDRPKIVETKLLKAWNEEHPALSVEGGVVADLDDPYAGPEQGSCPGDELLQEMNRLRGLQVPRTAWPMTVEAFATAWEDFKAQTHSVDFTDLIEHAILERRPIPGGATHLFLDEVQDFSPLEIALARQWGEECEALYLVGDDDQCLYAFKGASAQAFLSPAIPAEDVTILSQSYRVPPGIHAKAVAWIEEVTCRMPKTYKPREAHTGGPGFLRNDYRDPLTYIKEDLDLWLSSGKTVMFLASCSFFLKPLIHALREEGYPFHNPYRRVRGDWNPLHGRAGSVSAADRILAFRKVADTQQWWTYRDLYLWAAPLRCDDVFQHGAKSAMRNKAEDDATASLPVEIEDLEGWFSVHSAAEAAPAGDLDWYQRAALKSFEKPLAYACAVLEKQGAAALKRNPQITIGTIHSVKGAEADVVVLFPDLSPAGYEEWCTAGEPEDNIRRCFYVGMTRAREQLYWAQPAGIAIEGYL